MKPATADERHFRRRLFSSGGEGGKRRIMAPTPATQKNQRRGPKRPHGWKSVVDLLVELRATVMQDFTPEQKLAYSTIEHALLDITLLNKLRSSKSRHNGMAEEQLLAARWVYANTDLSPYNFLYLCTCLQMDPDVFRRALAKVGVTRQAVLQADGVTPIPVVLGHERTRYYRDHTSRASRVRIGTGRYSG